MPSRIWALWLLGLVGCGPAGDDHANLPEGAVRVAPNVYSLGRDIDPVSGDEVEGWVIVEGPGDFDRGALARAPKADPCWASLGHAGWSAAEDWGFDPVNSSGIAAADIQATLETGMATWEDGASFGIFGNYDATHVHTDTAALDGENNFFFGDTGGTTIVGRATVWAATSGPPSARHIYEWDIVMQDYGSKIFTVGTPHPYYFDLLNAAMHELGHAIGLGHPSTTCTEETMFGGIAIGETKKRDLNAGDLAGLASLY